MLKLRTRALIKAFEIANILRERGGINTPPKRAFIAASIRLNRSMANFEESNPQERLDMAWRGRSKYMTGMNKLRKTLIEGKNVKIENALIIRDGDQGVFT